MASSKFTLATLKTEHGPKAAICVNSRFYLLSEIKCAVQHATIKKLLQAWTSSFTMLQGLANDISIGKIAPESGILPDKADLLTPVLYPDNLLAVGANFADHLREMGLAATKWKSMPFFLRPPTSCLVGPGHAVQIPASTKQFDWECELAIVLGKQLRNASREEAADAIAGYSIGLDLSCRDLIQTDNDLKIDLVRGKAQDTMAPCGPVVVPKQFMPDVDDLRITLSVNGNKMMDSSTKEMLFKCDEQLSVIS